MSTSGRLYAQASLAAGAGNGPRNWEWNDTGGSIDATQADIWQKVCFDLGNSMDSAVAWGVDGILLHNPFGTRKSDGLYTADQFLGARREQPNLVEDFVRVWSEWMLLNQDIDVIAYVGTYMENERRGGSNLVLDEGGTTQKHQYWKSCLMPFEMCGMNLGLDISTARVKRHGSYEMALHWNSLGLQAYVEGMPQLTRPHWRNFGAIASPANFQQSQSDGWGVPLSLIEGPILLISDVDFSSTSAQITKIQEALALHPTAKVTIPVWWLIGNGVVLGDIE